MGLDPALFWDLGPREWRAVMTGAVARLKREHNDRAWLAWQTARLTAYAPMKSVDFVPLNTLQMGAAPRERAAPDWQRSFDAFSAWVRAAGGRT